MIVGRRHPRGPSSARPAFGLMSVIALLALACFPVFAHAEDSSGVQYSDAIPKAEGENTPTTHHQTPAKTSSTDKNGGAPAPTGTTGPANSAESAGGASENESSSKGGGVATGGNGGGTGQGKPGGSANAAGKTPVQHSSQAAGTPASQSSDSGSSPLVPILIAILALAAISVAAVMIRQRRQRRGPTTAPSPKAS